MKKTLFAFALAGLSAAPLVHAVPITINFSYDDGAPVSGVANLTASDLGGGAYLATSGTLTLTGGTGLLNGSFDLVPGGPLVFSFPGSGFNTDNLVYPGSDPVLDSFGLLGFQAADTFVNLWGNTPGNYSLWTSDSFGYTYTFDGPFTVSTEVGVPDGGATVGLLGVAVAGLGITRRKLR